MTYHHTARILPGLAIANRYMVEDVLGSGSFGAVYEVYDVETSTEMALKVLHPHMQAHQNARELMLREGKILQKLEHPNILKCYDVWEEGEEVYIATEILSGDTLATHLESGASLDPVFILTVIEQLADALAHLHERGIVHRDIKPENIFIEHRLGRAWPVIMDFGLAFVENSQTLGRLGKHTNAVSGTPLYMSPEQITNKQLSTPADVYALGSVLYEMVTGAAPFEGENISAIETMKRQVVATPEAFFLDWDEGALNTLAAWMLAKDPSERPLAAAVAEVLRAHELHPARNAPHGWHTTRPTPVGTKNALGKLAFRSS